MIHKFKTFFILFFSALIMIGCENANDDYFAEPDWLAAPLFKVLEEEGRFKHYLACIDRTLYSGQIREGGFFTLMAPNDEAFQSFMQKHGYATVESIPDEIVNQIVSYSIIQSYWLSENLSDFFRGTVGARYDRGDAFKKQTYYYKTIYQDPEFNNNWVIDQNVNSATFSPSTYNYKYFPVFMESYVSKANLTSADYNAFFPDVPLVSGQMHARGEIGNVVNGQIVTPNLKARNGIAHEVSVVNLPMDNMDKILQQSDYTAFKSLIDFRDMSGSYLYKNYNEDITLTERYKLLRPTDNISSVYVKNYATSGPQPLSFSPAVETIYNGVAVTTLSDGYTLFVPENNVLNDYINTKLLKYYSSINDLPVGAITTLINTHMVNTMVWPSQLERSQVSTGEFINGKGAGGDAFANFGVTHQELTSNGFIYRINRVIKSKLFETVFSEVYLNPAFSLMNFAFNNYFNNTLREELQRSVITGFPNQRYTLLLLSDEQLRADGFTYNYETNVFSHPLLVGTNVTDRMRRLIQNHVFMGWNDGLVDSQVKFNDGVALYGGWGFRNTSNGDVIRYKDGQLQASGNIEENTFVNITKVEDFDNGTVYKLDKMLQYSTRETTPSSADGWTYKTLWYYLQQTAIENIQVTQFVDYIQFAVKSPTSDELSGISENNFYTVIMPNNNAITRARANGDLPNLDSLRNGLLDPVRVELAANFVRSHFLEGNAMADDRLPFLYPYNPNSPNLNIVSTAYRVNNERERFINQRTYVKVSKDDNNVLTIVPDDIVQNGVLRIAGSYGMLTPAPRIMTGTARSGNNGYRSNRIAGRAIHHEYTNYFKFTIVRQ